MNVIIDLLKLFAADDGLPVVERAGQSFLPMRLDDGRVFLLPQHSLGYEETLDFPDHPQLESFSRFLRAGISIHEISIEGGGLDNDIENLSYKNLNLFNREEFLVECVYVLMRAGWIHNGDIISEKLIEELSSAKETFSVSNAKSRHGGSWGYHALEFAANNIAEPFSRLWYVASMYSLYWLGGDVLSLGYLWCEYKMKMRFEKMALKHTEIVKKNKEGGMKGGRGKLKSDRYNALYHYANNNFPKNFHEYSDDHLIKLVKKIARKAEGEHGPLFYNRGKFLSTKWFSDWLSEYRIKRTLKANI